MPGGWIDSMRRDRRPPDRSVMPSAVTPRVGLFDRFAGRASVLVSRSWFFCACVLLVVVWAPSYPLFSDVTVWQLIINSATTVITFLLVALLQNAQQRADQATQHKLNAVAYALSELMGANADADELDRAGRVRLRESLHELRAAVGLEERESA